MPTFGYGEREEIGGSETPSWTGSRQICSQPEAASQDVADRAREMLLEEQKRHDIDYGQAAVPFAKEAAEFHVRAIRFLNTEADIGAQARPIRSGRR